MLYATAQTRSWHIHSKRRENRGIFAWSCLHHAAGKCESQHRDWWLPAKFTLAPLQNQQTSVVATNTAFLFHTPEADSLHAEMDHTQLSSDAEDRAPLFMPESLTKRQRLRAIAAGGENLYEPPNTAEAFARLEAAIDEVKYHGSMSEGQGLIARRQRLKAIVATYEDLYEPPDTAEAFARLEAAIDEVKRHARARRNNYAQDPMLDPPTTAERFNRIETAIDEVLAEHDTRTQTPWRAKKSISDPHLSAQSSTSDCKEPSHLLRKRPLQSADHSTPAEPNGSPGKPSHETVSFSLRRRPRGYFTRHASLRPSTPGEADTITHSAVESISEAEATERNQDVDVFRDDDSVKAFADQTYQSVREKYL